MLLHPRERIDAYRYFLYSTLRLSRAQFKNVQKLMSAKIAQIANNECLNMIVSGAKGNKENFTQLSGTMGPQMDNEQMVGDKFLSSSDRMCYSKQHGDMSLEARGHIVRPIVSGLTPKDVENHVRGVRGGLVKTATETHEGGYLTRRIICCTCSTSSTFSRLVVDAENRILQYIYSGDGLESSQLERQHVSSDIFMEIRDYLGGAGHSAPHKNAPQRQRQLELKRMIPLYRRSLSFMTGNYGNTASEEDIHQNGLVYVWTVHVPRLLQRHSRFWLQGHLRAEKLKHTPNSSRRKYITFEQFSQGIEELCEELDFTAGPLANPSIALLGMLQHFRFHSTKYPFRLASLAQWVRCCKEILERFHQSFVECGEMLGVLAAQSIGEPAVQSNMKTWNVTGSPSQTLQMCDDVPRCKELIDVKPHNRMQTPSMIIPLLPSWVQNMEQATLVAQSINSIYLFQVIEDHTIMWIDMAQWQSLCLETTMATTSSVPASLGLDHQILPGHRHFQLVGRHIYETYRDYGSMCPRRQPFSLMIYDVSYSRRQGALKSEQIIDILQNLTAGVAEEDGVDSDGSLTAPAIHHVKCLTDSILWFQVTRPHGVVVVRGEDDQCKLKLAPWSSLCQETALLPSEEHAPVSADDWHFYYAWYYHSFYMQDLIRVELSKKLLLRGIDGIRACNILSPAVAHAKFKTPRECWVLETDGTAMEHILAHPAVHSEFTVSNAVTEFGEILNWEAANTAWCYEASKIFGDGSMFVSPRHLQLIADNMTFSGMMLPLSRSGLAKKRGFCDRAAFEDARTVLYGAAVNAEVDDLNGVIQNVFVGQRPSMMGTGRVHIFTDPSLPVILCESTPKERTTSGFDHAVVGLSSVADSNPAPVSMSTDGDSFGVSKSSETIMDDNPTILPLSAEDKFDEFVRTMAAQSNRIVHCS